MAASGARWWGSGGPARRRDDTVTEATKRPVRFALRLTGLVGMSWRTVCVSASCTALSWRCGAAVVTRGRPVGLAGVQCAPAIHFVVVNSVSSPFRAQTSPATVLAGAAGASGSIPSRQTTKQDSGHVGVVLRSAPHTRKWRVRRDRAGRASRHSHTSGDAHAVAASGWTDFHPVKSRRHSAANAGDLSASARGSSGSTSGFADVVRGGGVVPQCRWRGRAAR